MTTEKIIERLKVKFYCGFSIHSCDKCEIESCLDRDILNATIEALEKHPCDNKMKLFACPSCKRLLEGYEYYCWHCGHKIDWEEVSE